MFVGWDWASITHDITVIDATGAVVDRWAPPHTEQGLTQTITRLGRHGPRPTSPSLSNDPAAWRRPALGRGTRSCPSMRPRSTPPGPAGAPPAPNLTPATATNSPTTCAPTATGSAAFSAG